MHRSGSCLSTEVRVTCGAAGSMCCHKESVLIVSHVAATINQVIMAVVPHVVVQKIIVLEALVAEDQQLVIE